MPRPSLPIALLLLTALLGAPLLSVYAEDEEPPAPAVEKDDVAAKLAKEQAHVQRTVDDLRPVIAKLRGLDWKQPVKAAVMTRAQLREFMIAEMDKEVTPEEWARDTRILRRLGLITPDEDLKEMALHMFQSAVAGFYNPDTKRLYVIEGLDVEGQKPTMVHELIHALEDQHFDLKAMEEPYRENDPDRQFAIRCLWEGSAEYGRRLYQDMEMDVARHYYAASAKNPARAAQVDMMRRIPTYMLLPTLLHYRTGPNFVSHRLREDGYHAGMEKLLADQPTTQEQVLHPHKWLGAERDYPRTVHWNADLAAALGEGWTKLDEHSVGELDLAVYLDFFLGDEKGRLNMQTMQFGMFVDAQSNRAAQGWDAGRTIYVEDAEQNMVFAHAFAFDSTKDAEDAARFLGAARRAKEGSAWKGDGWVKADEADATRQHYDYVGANGRGRILQRGREVLLLDGVPDASFDKAWAALAKTSFEQHPADKGDAVTDPYEGCAVVDRRRGLGLMLPSDEWSAADGGRSPASFATASKGDVKIGFLVIDQEMSLAGLPNIARMVLGGFFDEKSMRASELMGRKGIRHGLPAQPGWTGTLHLAADGARTYIVTVMGPKDALAKAADDIGRLLAGMPGPTARAPAGAQGDLEGEGARPAGLRSIPGY